MNTLKFATERSYNTASFAQRLQRKPRPRRATARNRPRATCVLTESDANQQTRQVQDVALRNTPPAQDNLPAAFPTPNRQCITPSSTSGGCTPSPLPAGRTQRETRSRSRRLLSQPAVHEVSRNSPLELHATLRRHPASQPDAHTKTAERQKHTQGEGTIRCCFCAASLARGTRYQCQTCPEVAFCSNCKQNASFIHPNRGHRIERIDNGGDETPPRTDIAISNNDKDRVHEVDRPGFGDATEASVGLRASQHTRNEEEDEVVDAESEQNPIPSRTTQAAPGRTRKCTLCGEILSRTWHECPTCVYKFCSSCTLLHPIHELVAVTGEAEATAGYTDETVNAGSDDGHQTPEGVHINVDEDEADASREGVQEDWSAGEEVNVQVVHSAEASLSGLEDVDMSDHVDESDDELDVDEPDTDDPGVDDDVDGEPDITDDPDVASSIDSDGDKDDEVGASSLRRWTGPDQATPDPLVPLSTVLPAIHNALSRFIRDNAIKEFMDGIACDLRQGPSRGTSGTHQTRLNLLDFDLGLASLEARSHSAVKSTPGRHRTWLPEDRRQLARLKAKGWTD